MAQMTKPRGSHKHLTLVVCDRCGHKEGWTARGLALMRLHIRECQPDLAADTLPDRPGACTQNPCRNGDHYGQCWGITAPYLETRETA